MNPITSYSTSCFPHKQCFTLWPDRLHVTGTVFLSQDYETTMPLSNLSGIISRSTFRSQFFHAGVFLLILFGFVSIEMLGFVAIDAQMWILRFLFFALFILGIALCLSFARKFEVVTFTNKQGIRMLSIVGAAKQKQRFDEFTKAVTDAICNQPKV